MDAFYDIIDNAQRTDPEFGVLVRKSAGKLNRRLIETGVDEEVESNIANGDVDEEFPVFKVELTRGGVLSIGFSEQIATEDILQLLEHVREVIEQNSGD